MAIPVTLTPVEIHINADRQLVFQYLTAFGAAGPDGKRTSVVLEDHGTRKLVEFTSHVKDLRRRTKRVTTVEWVTLNEPEAIDFEGVRGPLPLLRDRLELDDHGSCTVLRYRSTIGARGGIFGWPVAKWYAKPIVARHMREHLGEIKEAVEARARRSMLFPYEACTHGAPQEPVLVEGA